MSDMTKPLALSTRLSRWLLPLGLLIGCCISFGLPATFYGIGVASLKRTATIYAMEFTKDLTSLVLETQGLWKYQAQKYQAVLQHFLPYKNIAQVRVLDDTGQPVLGYTYTETETRAWWQPQPLRSTAPIVFNDRTVGLVEVSVTYDTVLLFTMAIFLGCVIVGLAMALCVYIIPMRVVKKMELQITTLVDDLQDSNSALEQRAADNAQLVTTLQQALRALEAKNAELDSFVYSVSHDLKAPLVTLQGMSSLLLEDYGTQLDGDGRYYIERLQANTQHMERLITDLLALSRVGREARTPEMLSLDAILDDCLMEQAELIRERGAAVRCGELGMVWAIRTQMSQILSNLLNNALKYLGDTPGPRIEIGSIEHETFLECYVRDNGIGIDPAYHTKIFEVFQRLKDVEAEGSGVGLAIVKKIVEAAGGRIWVESATGQGATFHFTWPKPLRRPADADESTSDDSPGGGQSRPCNAHDARVEGWQPIEQGLLG